VAYINQARSPITNCGFDIEADPRVALSRVSTVWRGSLQAFSDAHDDHVGNGAKPLPGLPYLIFMVIPVLGRMSDLADDIRSTATNTFASLVKMVPLEVCRLLYLVLLKAWAYYCLTKAFKCIRAQHMSILSGTPIQNNVL
jgi:hypothetical protein